jgi:hypothetical protein
MSQPQIKLVWSKKENDWLYSYPDSSGKFMMSVFFDFPKLKINGCEGAPILKEFLEMNGYDSTTLKITCKKKKQ